MFLVSIETPDVIQVCSSRGMLCTYRPWGQNAVRDKPEPKKKAKQKEKPNKKKLSGFLLFSSSYLWAASTIAGKKDIEVV